MSEEKTKVVDVETTTGPHKDPGPPLADVEFTQEEAGLILAIVQQCWKTPLGTRQAAKTLGSIEDKLIAAKLPGQPALS